MKTKHTIELTTKELETLIFHLSTDLEEYGCNGSWGDGDGFINDNYSYTPNPNRRTKRGDKILVKLRASLWK